MLEQQLRQLADDAPSVDPTASVAQVVRRGRLWSFATRAVTTVSGLAMAATAAVAVPAMLEGPPESPAVLGVPEHEAVSKGEEPVRGEADSGESSPKQDGGHRDESGHVAFDVDVEILDPDPGTVTDAGEIEIEGRVEAGASVTVQGVAAEVADGAFRAVVRLSPGKNRIKAVARIGEDRFGIDVVVVERLVDEPQPEPQPEQEKDPDPEPQPDPEPDTENRFTAVQVHDQTEHDPPYSVYEGTASPGSWIKVRSEYGSAKTQADADGGWRVKVWFESAPYGTHTWTVSVHLLESTHEERFEFTGTRPEPKTETEVAFTANQTHGQSDADPPTDVFWGTAQPGTEVWVYSEYGQGTVTANDAGEWEIEVAFPDAPTGTSFPVKVKSLHTGEKVLFEFTRLG